MLKKDLEKKQVELAHKLREENTRKFLQSYKEEAKRLTHKLRVISFPTGEGLDSSPQMIGADGELHTGKESITHGWQPYYTDLTSANVTGTVEDMKDNLRRFTEGIPGFEQVREEMFARSAQIMKKIDMSELTRAISETAVKAPNPNDLVEVSTFKTLVGLAGCEGDDEKYKKCAKNAAIVLQQVLGCMNRILKAEKIPEEFQNGVICPLHKSGSVLKVSNYRPITLLPVLYKLFTRILTRRIRNEMEMVNGSTSNIQAGNRSNMSCHTQIATLIHIIKHAQRNKKKLYMVSTDVRKAFDTVSYQAFSASLESMGFSNGLCRLIDSLQNEFTCTVRTPCGMSEKIQVNRGCKQGCSLSPLRFILVYDMFLRYLEHSGKGYKWEIRHEGHPTPHVAVPACALADDMIMFSDNAEDFTTITREFDEFLQTVGLSLNSAKCHYTTVGEENPPHLSFRNEGGTAVQVQHQANTKPMKYLGYWIVVGDGKSSLSDTWAAHNNMIRDKLKSALHKMERSKIRAPELVNMVNSDAMSTISYFRVYNWMRQTGNEKRETGKETEIEVEQENGGRTRKASPVHANKLREYTYKTISRKLKLMPNSPEFLATNRSSGKGLGIRHPRTIYYTAKIQALLDNLNTHNRHCSILTRETLGDIIQATGHDVLNPRTETPTEQAMSGFPSLYIERHQYRAQKDTRPNFA